MKNWIGKAMILIGLIHSSFGLIVLREFGRPILEGGIFNTVHGQPEQEAFFWFIFSGVTMIMIGMLINWIEKLLLPFPKFIGWFLLGLSLTTVFIMPASGGWLVLAPAIGAILKSRTAS